MPNSEDKILDVYCTNCNVRTEARIVATHVKSRCVEPHKDPIDSLYYVTVYTFAVCRRCESPFLHEHNFAEVPGDFSKSQGKRMLFPQHQDFVGEGVPEKVRQVYRNAVRSYTVGLYEPCVIMCRKCLEAICYELGETKGNLQRRLLSLRDKKKIATKLLSWADGLRLIGNDAAHELDVCIDQADADDSIQFIEALLMYVFTLNVRYDEFHRRRAESSRT